MPGRLRGLERVEEAIRRFKLLDRKDKVIVGFSGGADSTYCLLSLKILGYDVSALHINHGIRENARRDEEWCLEFCRKLGVDIFVERLNIGVSSGVEEKARAERYRVFYRYSSLGYDKVALAHNLTDAFETLLFNTIRGTGIMGLVMPPKTGVFIRPVILLCREEIREGLMEHGYRWVEDETNLNPQFSRNFIRINIEPLLGKIFHDWCNRFRNTYVNLYEEKEVVLSFIEEYKKYNFIDVGGVFAVRIHNPMVALRIISQRLDVEIKPLRKVLELKEGKKFYIKGYFLVRFRDNIVGIYSKLKPEDLNVKSPDDKSIIRFRRPGDSVGGRKIGELFEKAKIPAFIRSIYPILEADGRIVSVPPIYGKAKTLKSKPDKPDFFEFLKFLQTGVPWDAYTRQFP